MSDHPVSDTAETPETDAAQTPLYDDQNRLYYAVCPAFARRLERQRDAALAELERVKTELASLKYTTNP